MLVSVIMPVYNVEDYLDDSIRSVAEQTFTDFELIIIDDGSTDDSGAIANTWKERDNRIRVIHQDNQGLSGARNTGIAESSGQFITFIDSDDYIASSFLERMISLQNEYDADAVITSHTKFCDGKAEPRVHRGDITCTGREYVVDIFGPRVIGAYAWGKLFKREAFNSIKFPVGRLYEDIFTIPYVLYDMKTVLYIDEGLYYYRQRPGSILSSYTPRRADELYAISDIVGFAKERRDRLLCWYASINQIRAWSETKHRFRKHGYDFSVIQRDMGQCIRDCIRFVLFPVFR